MAKKNRTARAAGEVEESLMTPAVLKAELELIRLRLETVVCVLITVSDALRLEQAEHNCDYANCVRHCAVERLQEQMDYLESMAKRLGQGAANAA